MSYSDFLGNILCMYVILWAKVTYILGVSTRSVWYRISVELICQKFIIDFYAYL